MKIISTILSLLFLSVCSAQTTKISEMQTFNGNASEAYVPIIKNGVNYKTLGRNFVAGKVDSIKIKKTPGQSDSLFQYYNGSKYFAGTIEKGDGIKRVLDIEDRDSIPSGDRYEGMIVYVSDVKKYYSLKGGITNSDWVEFTSGGSGGGGVFIDNF